jgi:hypothetical protein
MYICVCVCARVHVHGAYGECEYVYLCLYVPVLVLWVICKGLHAYMHGCLMQIAPIKDARAYL